MMRKRSNIQLHAASHEEPILASNPAVQRSTRARRSSKCIPPPDEDPAADGAAAPTPPPIKPKQQKKRKRTRKPRTDWIKCRVRIRDDHDGEWRDGMIIAAVGRCKLDRPDLESAWFQKFNLMKRNLLST